jgi:protein involved in sex pheromone biosynthesis
MENSASVANKLHLSQKESEISRKYEIADEYWKSVLTERERKAIDSLDAIIKAQKYLADFRSGKIAGVLV